MKERMARSLKEGSRVAWDKNFDDEGTVIEVGFNAVKIKWDNGQIGVIHFRDMANIGLGKPTGKPRPGETWDNLSRSEVGI